LVLCEKEGCLNPKYATFGEIPPEKKLLFSSLITQYFRTHEKGNKSDEKSFDEFIQSEKWEVDETNPNPNLKAPQIDIRALLLTGNDTTDSFVSLGGSWYLKLNVTDRKEKAIPSTSSAILIANANKQKHNEAQLTNLYFSNTKITGNGTMKFSFVNERYIWVGTYADIKEDKRSKTATITLTQQFENYSVNFNGKLEHGVIIGDYFCGDEEGEFKLAKTEQEANNSLLIPLTLTTKILQRQKQKQKKRQKRR